MPLNLRLLKMSRFRDIFVPFYGRGLNGASYQKLCATVLWSLKFSTQKYVRALFYLLWSSSYTINEGVLILFLFT